jgi:hypothetical protein
VSRAAIICLLHLLFYPACVALAQDLTPSEQGELQVCRNNVPNFLKQIEELQSRVSACEAPSKEARDYEKQYWEQKGEMLQVEHSAFLWQKTASSVVLGLVVLITLSGILLAAYQLYLSFKIGQKIDAQTLDISAQRAQVTSSVVGVTILVIAGIFLMIFLKEIYGIEYVAPSPPSLAQDKSAAPSQPGGVSATNKPQGGQP